MLKRSLYILTGVLIFLIIIAAIYTRFDIPVEKLIGKYANKESKFIEIDGMKVHYRDEGKGIPVILLHGTAASLHTWDDWTSELKKSYRVIRLDLPAFGLTGPHPQRKYDIQTYVSFLHHFLQKIKNQNIQI